MSEVIKSPGVILDEFLKNNSVLSSSGYQKLPNGLIIQWWEQTGVSIDSNQKFTSFPIAFTSNVYMIQGTNSRSAPISGTYEVSVDRDTITLTGFNFYMDFDTNTTGTDNDVYWFAIGS